VAWPLLVLAQVGEGFGGREGVQFWQLYFITTPHRWITLVLVFCDRERFGQRKLAFLAVAAAIIVICLSVRMTTGTLMCLLTIDYVWNAWHFAAQHHGIYRIYSRRVGGDERSSTPTSISKVTVEKWAMRLFLSYVILRVAGVSWRYTALEAALRTIDWLALAVPAWLLIRDLATASGRITGKTLYLASMVALYVSLLVAVNNRQPALVLSLATASALFHATEYLALVAWAVKARHTARGDQLGLLSYLAPRWGLALGAFVFILGSSGWLLQQHLLKPWLLANVIIAFLHYAYDGMIWGRRAGV